jgi:hypothetical protein
MSSSIFFMITKTSPMVVDNILPDTGLRSLN